MKSKHQRQIEAIARKKMNIPKSVQRLQEAAQRAKADPADLYAQREVASLRAALARLFREVGYHQVEAEGMANSVSAGGSPDAWLSQAPSSQGRSSTPGSAQREPTTLDQAMRRLDEVVPGATAALLVPHPFRPSIQVRADADACDGSFIVDMSILEIDRLASRLRDRGVRVFRTEASYMEHQLAKAAA